MRKRSHLCFRRRVAAVLTAALVLWLVFVTAASSSAQAALSAISQQGELTLTLLRSQLGDWRAGETLPASVNLVLSQSPVLLGGRSAVLTLRGREEGEDDTQPQPAAPAAEDPDDDSGTVTLPEEPTQPTEPLVFADNGIPAKTLIPTSTDGYIVSGGVYITNTSDNSFDAGLFDGTFAAALSEEEGPQVLIVHTHGSEAYTMPAGQEYVPSGDCRTTDEQYNVVRVGEELTRALEEAGLSVLHDTTLHDYPEYSGAYGRSLTTVERYLAQYPTISFVLDLHRDAISDGNGSPYKVVSTVAGVNAAQLSFVIGTDGGGLEHPGWRENLKLAAAVQQHILEDYPTLMRPITVRNSRYNQHTTPGSLLIEVGAAGNSLDEALLSARILGKALGEVMLAPIDSPGLADD